MPDEFRKAWRVVCRIAHQAPFKAKDSKFSSRVANW